MTIFCFKNELETEKTKNKLKIGTPDVEVVYCTDGLDVPRSDGTVRGGAADCGAGVPQLWKVD